VLVLLSPEQQAYAQERVDAYLAAVRQGLRRAPSHRYVAIETLPMATGGRCVTVYDTGSGKFVSHGGYTVGGLPGRLGDPTRFVSVRVSSVTRHDRSAREALSGERSLRPQTDEWAMLVRMRFGLPIADCEL
jgi:hypothetical protein